MQLRPATAADREAVLHLAVAEEAAWFGEAEISAAEFGEWLDSDGELVDGVVADDGAVRGFALQGRNEAWLLVDPGHLEVLPALLGWLREQQAAFTLQTFAGDAERVALLEQQGFTSGHSSFQLGRPNDDLPHAELPDGVELHPYTWGADDAAVHRLIYIDAQWTAVEGHADRDLESWLKANHGCDALFLARRDGKPVGWTAGRVLESGRGLIQTLAVAQTERRHGLGRALLLNGFADLIDRGARDLTLGVEAQNDKALGLYQSIGMTVEREWRTYSSISG